MELLFSHARKLMAIAASLLFLAPAQATTYTAISSGNYTNVNIWDQAAPFAVAPGDVIVVPAGTTVTLDADLYLQGTLILSSGILALNGYDLNISNQGNLEIDGAGYIAADQNSSISNVNFLSSPLKFGAIGSVKNLSIDLANDMSNVSLGSDIFVNGQLSLEKGTLSLAGNDLTFANNGTVSASGTGSIFSTASSDIAFMSNNSIGGALRFSPIGNTVNQLIINFPYSNHDVRMGSDVTVNGTLILGSGHLSIDGSTLRVANSANITGGSEQSFITTSNGGKLSMELSANEIQTWQLGTAEGYAPVRISANPGCVTSNISVSCDSKVLSNGNSGAELSLSKPVVNTTWFISSSATAGLDYNVQMMWSAGMEVNGFDRTNSFVSQFVNGGWDTGAAANAIMNSGLYAMSRSNLNKTGAFTVADMNSALGVKNTGMIASDIQLYPNPARDVLHISGMMNTEKVEISDISGRVIKTNIGNAIDISDLGAGYYIARLKSGDNYIAKTFVKAD